MVKPRSPQLTVKCVDTYCELYRNLFLEVRAYEAFKYLHIQQHRHLLTLSHSWFFLTEAIYQKRWKVEVFHKTLKSNTGLAKLVELAIAYFAKE